MNVFNYTTPKHGEMFTILLEHKNIRINRIVSSNDSEQIEYIQEEDEWVVVLEGKATLLLESEEKTLFKGDTLLIPAQTPHKVLKTEQGTLWLAVHIY
ncbi:cupin [Sulfurovum lithotrophicum]|uniref:Cupin n=1 Tax=Sulfurovum lithotrophicum TaxID=206403 RepID=A0A7U4M2I9_9BACT|nr:cupin domain-containing protein [Sulfurovum lithotrophicum]AKF25683.1 cupin [Sulfurovum lithotrophicum]